MILCLVVVLIYAVLDLFLYFMFLSLAACIGLFGIFMFYC